MTLNQFEARDPNGELISVSETRADAEHAIERDLLKVKAKYKIFNVTNYDEKES